MSFNQRISALLLLTIGVFLLRRSEFSPTTLFFSSSSSPDPVQFLETEDIYLNEHCSASNLKVSTVFSDFQISLANKSHGFVEFLRGENRFVELITERNLSIIQDPKESHPTTPKENRDELYGKYTRTMIPLWIVMGIFFTIALYCYWGFLCTSRGAGKSFFKIFHRKGLGIKKKYLNIISLILVSILVFLGISGAIVASQIEDDTDKALCTWHSFLEDAVQGNPANDWLGMIPISNSLFLLNSFVDLLERDTHELRAKGTKSMDTYLIYINVLANASFHFTNTMMPRVDTTSEDVYLPDFIENTFPMSATERVTHASRLIGEFNGRHIDARKAISEIHRDFHYQFQLNKTNLTAAIKKTKTITDDAALGAQNILELSNYYSHSISSTTKNSQSMLRVTFILVCFVSIFCILFWFFIIALRTRIVNCLNLGWWLLSGLSMMGWVVSMIATPYNIGFMESCGVLSKSLSDPVFFNQTMSLLIEHSSSLNQYMYTCLHGDADIPLTFGLIKPTKVFTEVYNVNLLKYISQLTGGFPHESHLLPEISAFLDEYRLGLKPDSAETIVDLRTLNKNSKPATSVCPPMKDHWVLHKRDCQQSEKRFSAHETEDFNVGEPTCIVFEDWGKRDIAERYKALKLKTGCEDPADETSILATQKFVNNFAKNRVEITNTIDQIQDALKNMTKEYEIHMNYLNSFSHQAKNIGDNLVSLNETLFSPKEGIMNNMRCPVIKKDLAMFHDNLCVGLIPTLFQITVIILIFSILSMISTGALFYLSRNMREYNISYEKLRASQKLVDNGSAYQKIEI